MSTWSEADELQSRDALEFVKRNRNRIIHEFADSEHYTPSEQSVSLFMAGAPGAGKTETSRALIESGHFFEKPVRIDADEIRELIPGYQGMNAAIFQRAAEKGVNLLYDYVLDRRLSCILDGTFAYGGARENVERSLRRDRKVIIYYIHQDPGKAWEVTKARQLLQGRHVPKEAFVHAAIFARKNVEDVKALFGKDIELYVIVKDFDRGDDSLLLNQSTLDPLVVPRYTENEIMMMIT